jgi:hypothetical protein
MKFRLAILTAFVGAMLLGCSSRLETGYLPRKLGASNTERRGFYAMPFTREARAAEMEREAEFDARRPRPGY